MEEGDGVRGSEVVEKGRRRAFVWPEDSALRWVERKVFRTGLGLESEEGGTCRGFRTNDSEVVNDGEAERMWV